MDGQPPSVQAEHARVGHGVHQARQVEEVRLGTVGELGPDEVRVEPFLPRGHDL